MAFPRWIRKKMFKRDNATCQKCGKKWHDGWMLHAAHHENKHSKPTSNALGAGRMICVSCHLSEHARLYNLASKRGDTSEMKRHKSAIGALKKTNRRRRGW